MTDTLAWLAGHYGVFRNYLLTSSSALLIGTLASALSQRGVAARWPRRLAALSGIILTALGVALALAKALNPHVLRQLSWANVVLTVTAGIVLVAVAWSLTARYGRKTQQRLRPMAEAAWRSLSRSKDAELIGSYFKLRTSDGQPAVDEILTSIRKKRSPPLLLPGAGGTGKTLVLLSLAARCRSIFNESRRQLIIPVYVDVAQLAIQESRVPLRDFILNQLGSDTEFVQLLKDAWADQKTNVIWLFLFDNVDRPLLRWGSGEGADGWSAELVEFLDTNPARFRAVLAGHDLSRFAGKRIELAPLSRNDRAKFLSSLGVTQAQQAALTHEESFRQYVENPGWLCLVSDYLAQVPAATPYSFRDLMDSAIARQIRAIAGTRQDIHDELITAVAQETAAQIVLSQTTYGIPRLALVQLLCEKSHVEQDQVDLVIDELIHYNVMVRFFKGEDEFIGFRYDSVKSYFTINSALRGGATLSIDKLLRDPSNTTVAISLLQFGSEDLVREILRTTHQYLSKQEPVPQASTIVINRMLSSANISLRGGVAQEGDPSPWTRETYHLLHILEAGLSRWSSGIPETLRDTTDILLAHASAEATPRMREQMLDVQTLASADVAAACCAASLRSKSGRLVDAATRKVMSRQELLDRLDTRDQIRFMISAALIGVDSWTSQHIDPEYYQRLSFASLVGLAVGPLFFLVFGVSDVIHIATDPSKSGSFVLTLIIAAGATVTVLAARKSPGVANRLLAVPLDPIFYALFIIAAFGVFAFIICVLEIVTGHPGYLSNLLPAYVFLWPLSSLYYLTIESAPSFWRCVFPLRVILVPLWSLFREHYPHVAALPTRRQLLKWSLGIIVAAVLLILTTISVDSWRFGATNLVQYRHIHKIATWTAWIVIAVCVSIVPIVDSIQDWRWIQQWRRAPFESNSDDVMTWLSSLRTRIGTKHMIVILTRKEPTYASIGILPSMHELRRVLDWVEELSEASTSRMRADTLATIPPYLTPHAKEWIKQYDKRYPGRLYVIANSRLAEVRDYVVALNQLALKSGVSMSEIGQDGILD